MFCVRDEEIVMACSRNTMSRNDANNVSWTEIFASFSVGFSLDRRDNE